jgi:pimeloyl-ACP methyl ester carboxylesterase
MKDSLVDLDGGRRLACTEIGDAEGPCLFFFHGAPMSRLHLRWLEREFVARGLRVVSPDRPGYGGSSPQPGRSMADWPKDVAAAADALGVERFLIAGHSSGGPYALACCALLPDRVLGGAIVAGVTDMAWPPAWDGYIESEAQLMREPDEAAAIAWCTARYGADGSGFFSDGFALPEPDVARLADTVFAQAMNSTLVEAFRQGVIGYAQDCAVQGRPWPFDPGRIAAPIVVAHGELDTLLPIAHSRHTAEVVPGAVFRTLPGHGHLTIVTELPAIAASLLPSAG